MDGFRKADELYAKMVMHGFKKADELYAKELHDYLFHEHAMSYKKIFSDGSAIHKRILKDLEILESDLSYFLRDRGVL